MLPDSGNLGPGLALQLSQNCSDNKKYFQNYDTSVTAVLPSAFLNGQ